MGDSNELRIFISSTFRDLQEEREHLVKNIFPEIRARCRERGITFTEVDLRWGLTHDDGTYGRIIRTCLEEVDRCRPYFIGITGNRYGYIPEYLDIQKDPELLRQFPWVEQAVIEEQSITSMEVHYAVLEGSAVGGKKRDETGTARFYFREERASLEESTTHEEAERLGELKQLIRSSGAVVQEFRDPVSLGELVHDDLIEVIRRDFADAKPPTELEEERMKHRAFSASRRHAYIANPSYLKRINEWYVGDDQPLALYAESGSGKSSLVAFWCEQLRRREPETFIVEHYVGIGAGDADHLGAILHVMEEIRERFSREEELPQTSEEIEWGLGQWLGYASHDLKNQGGRMVLVLDGLNQLQGRALNLSWIPDVMPQEVRLIVTTTVEETLIVLRRRGWDQLGIQPLEQAEREAVVVRYLSEYRKALPAETVRQIASDPKCAHPLFLRTLLEELRLFGEHERIEHHVRWLLESTGTEDLFQRVLERMEEDYNARAVREVMSLIAASREGLSEEELVELTGISRMRLSTLLLGLDYHVVRRDGLLSFFHDYLRRAVVKRYLSEVRRQQSAYLQIAEYFQRGVSAAIGESARVPVRMARELAYQLNAAGEVERLHELLATIPVFLSLYSGQTLTEVLEYWSAVTDAHVIDDHYRRGLDAWEGVGGAEWSAGLGRVVELFAQLGRWSSAIDLCRERLSSAVDGKDVPTEAASRARLGQLLQMRGEFEEAMVELSQALELYGKLGDRSGEAVVQGAMGTVHYDHGEFDQALECFETQLQLSTELGDRRAVAHGQRYIGSVHRSRGEYDQALKCYEVSLRICEQLGDQRGVAGIIHNIGTVNLHRGKKLEALQLFQQALRINEGIGNRHWMGNNLGNLGAVYIQQHEYDRALECYDRQLRICTELGDRIGEATAHCGKGIVFEKRGEFERALEGYEAQWRISEELGDRNNAAVAQMNIGNVHLIRGDYERALELFAPAAAELREIGYRLALSYALLRTAQTLLELVESGGEQMPTYLTAYVPEVEGGGWHAVTLRMAREHAEECRTTFEELSSPDPLFASQVLLGRIAAADGDTEAAFRRLDAMLASSTDDQQRAELHYWLWKLSLDDGTDHRTKAERHYAVLVADIPTAAYDISLRLQELRAAAPASSHDGEAEDAAGK